MAKSPAHRPLSLRLILPLPPSINEQYATVNGRRVRTLVAKHFKQNVLKKVQELERTGQFTAEMREQFGAGYLALLLVFYFETPLKRDLDGGLKISQDALCSTLGLNDNRVVSVHMLKYIFYHPYSSPFIFPNTSACKNKRRLARKEAGPCHRDGQPQAPQHDYA